MGGSRREGERERGSTGGRVGRREGGDGSVLSLTRIMLDLNQDKLPDFHGVPHAKS